MTLQLYYSKVANNSSGHESKRGYIVLSNMINRIETETDTDRRTDGWTNGWMDEGAQRNRNNVEMSSEKVHREQQRKNQNQKKTHEKR